jgi:uncharacterized membrane protein
MKKKRITYGVYGMMEYQAIIKVGKATLKVQFTDGSITAYGQNPAQFTTADFIVQHAIENSSDFKRGRIKRVSVIELDEDVHIERNPEKATAPEATATAETGTEIANETASATTEETAGSDEGEAEPAEAEATGEATTTEVEFTCNADAKEYLENNFGVKASLRTRADIIACGETYGVKISFAE